MAFKDNIGMVEELHTQLVECEYKPDAMSRLIAFASLPVEITWISNNGEILEKQTIFYQRK